MTIFAQLNILNNQIALSLSKDHVIKRALFSLIL